MRHWRGPLQVRREQEAEQPLGELAGEGPYGGTASTGAGGDAVDGCCEDLDRGDQLCHPWGGFPDGSPYLLDVVAGDGRGECRDVPSGRGRAGGDLRPSRDDG